MKTPPNVILKPSANTAQIPPSKTMHGKKVVTVNTRILNPTSDFAQKRLCDGPTFTAGSACVFTCRYCYVETMMNRGSSEVAKALRQLSSNGQKQPFQQTIIRREEPVAKLQAELAALPSAFKAQKLVVFASPAVDVAATLPLATETIELTKMILSQTNWDVRLLSKSPLLIKVAEQIPANWKSRVIYGLSTGTLDDRVAKAIEPDAPMPSKRLEALKLLQDRGHRTFAMLCPVLPQDLTAFITAATAQINFDRCETVWAEILNRRGKSMELTAEALATAGLTGWAEKLRSVYGSGSTPRWEAYARSVFGALTAIIPAGKLNFLQYVNATSQAWWQSQTPFGALPLGKITHQEPSRKSSAKPVSASGTLSSNATTAQPSVDGSFPLTPARKAWKTMREKYTPEQIHERCRKAAQKAWETRNAKKAAQTA